MSEDLTDYQPTINDLALLTESVEDHLTATVRWLIRGHPEAAAMVRRLDGLAADCGLSWLSTAHLEDQLEELLAAPAWGDPLSCPQTRGGSRPAADRQGRRVRKLPGAESVRAGA